ncbi:MAG: hypothetical protein BKP49_02715 [Treponema sp. CETP13]|nr:MAG: hypothetical protein BKP49_02715 [Treponema sp. CETP13]
MKRWLIFLFMIVGFTGILWGESCSVKLTISNITVEKGTLYISVYNSKESFKKKDFFVLKKILATAETQNITIEVPYGEYVFSLFQDENSNGKLDTKIFGIPKEKVGISNYNGKGIPGGFDSLKLAINTPFVTIPIKLTEI